MNKNKTKKQTYRSLSNRNQLMLAYLELAGDRTFLSLDEAARRKLILEVQSIGREAAKEAVEQHQVTDPRKLAAKIGLKVTGEERGKKGLKYSRQKKEIIIYRSFHDRLMQEIQSTEVADNLLKFIIAHQLFHHLELHGLGEVYRRFKFLKWKLGPYSRYVFIRGLSNVAAQAFTLQLLQLEITPQVFDYLAYILYSNNVR